MADIGTWSNTTPGTDMTASAMDDVLRDTFISMQSGLSESMYWLDGSANSDGIMKEDTARSFWSGSASPPWLGGSADGTFGVISGDILVHSGSQQTGAFSNSRMQEHAVSPGTGARWVASEGTVFNSVNTIGSSANTALITYGITYVNPPCLFLSVAELTYGDDENDVFFIGAQQVSRSTAFSMVSVVAGGGPYTEATAEGAGVVVHWRSEGTVNY